MRKKIMYYCNKHLFEDKKPRNFGKSSLENFNFSQKVDKNVIFSMVTNMLYMQILMKKIRNISRKFGLSEKNM